jgi:hypothetical protein
VEHHQVFLSIFKNLGLFGVVRVAFGWFIITGTLTLAHWLWHTGSDSGTVALALALALAHWHWHWLWHTGSGTGSLISLSIQEG